MSWPHHKDSRGRLLRGGGDRRRTLADRITPSQPRSLTFALIGVAPPWLPVIIRWACRTPPCSPPPPPGPSLAWPGRSGSRPPSGARSWRGGGGGAPPPPGRGVSPPWSRPPPGDPRRWRGPPPRPPPPPPP